MFVECFEGLVQIFREISRFLEMTLSKFVGKFLRHTCFAEVYIGMEWFANDMEWFAQVWNFKIYFLGRLVERPHGALYHFVEP